jgi:WD40 repeat protein/predicted ATPase/tetratricopeptide (TPR) repeat protein
LIETVEAPKRFTGQVTVHLSLQPIVLEYMTSYFVSTLRYELETEKWDLFQRYLLVKAQAPDYVRQLQRRLLLQPLLDNLALQWGKQQVAQRLLRLLPILHERIGRAPGYAAANLLHLLIGHNVDLQGLNFSHLAIWQADLRRVHLTDVNFAAADLKDSAFAEHFGGVTATCFSPDHRLLAAATTDGNIYLWNTNDGHLVGVCRGNNRWIWSVAIAADGQTLAAGCADKSIRLWDIGDLYATTGQFLHATFLLRTLQGHEDAVFAVAFSPDGLLLVSGSGDATIRLWQVATGALVATQQGHTAGITAISIAPTVQPPIEGPTPFQYASAGKDGQVLLWSSASVTPLQTLQAHTERLLALAFHPDGATIFSGGADQTILRWSLATGSVAQYFAVPCREVLSLACTADTLAAGAGDHKIYLWDLQTGKQLAPLTGHTEEIHALAFAGDGHMLVSGSFDQTIRLWDLQKGHPLRIHFGCRNHILALALHPNGRLIANGSVDGILSLWQSPSALRAPTEQTAVEPVVVARRFVGTTRALVYHPDGRHMVSGGDGGTLRLWTADHQLQWLAEIATTINDLVTIAISHNGEWLAIGGNDGHVVLMHFPSRHCLPASTVSKYAVQALAFTPDDQQLLCGCADGRVMVYGFTRPASSDDAVGAPPALLAPLDGSRSSTYPVVAADQEKQPLLYKLFSLQTRSADVLALAVSPDGRFVAIGGAEPGIEVWEIASQQVAFSYSTPSSIFTLAFSPNGEWLAAGGGSHFFALWELATHQEQQPVSEHQGVVRQLRFAADSQQIFTCGDDETIRLWQLNHSAWRHRAVLRPPSLYSGLNIYGATGINGEQQQALCALGAVEQASVRAPNRQQHNIPGALTPLYGRVTEVEALVTRLLKDETRIVTLVGEGGVGKTHLALEVARVLLGIKPLGYAAPVREPIFTDGVWLITLATVPADERRTERLINAIAGVLNLTFHQHESPQQQLFSHLQPRHLLLILDNFDALRQETAFLLALLMAAPYVKLLITSRYRLDLFAQIVHCVNGLATPTETEAVAMQPDELMHYAAIQLFVEQANRLTGSFQLTAATRDQVIRICQFMNGLPLGIKLAAAQLANYQLSEIALRMQNDLSLLTSTAADLPVHQRSLQTVLTESWADLSPDLAHTLAGCVAFAGSFNLSTAVTVVSTTGAILEDLTARSLLHREHNRYVLHEFVGAFLQQQPTVTHVIAQARARHAAHYAHLLDSKGRRKQNSMANFHYLAEELVEINRAWQWALDQLDLALLQQSVEGIFFLYECLGQFPEALYLLRTAAAVIQQDLAALPTQIATNAEATAGPSRAQQAKALLAEITFFCGMLNNMMGNLAEAQRAANHVVALGRMLKDSRHQARGYYLLALQGQQRAQFTQATKWIMRAAQLAERHNLVELQITAANVRGILYDMQGDHRRAVEQYQQALPLAIATQDRFQERLLVNNLGIVALSMGDWENARIYLERNLELSNESGSASKQTYALMNYGLLLNALGLYDQARQHLLHGLQLARNVHHRQSEVYLLLFLAQNCFYSGHIGIGIKYAEEALIQIDEHQFHSLKAAALAILAHNLLATEELDRASTYYTESIAQWLAMNNRLEIGTSLAGYAYVQLRMGHLDQALVTVEELLPMLDAIISDNATEAPWVILSCYLVLQEAHDVRARSILQQGRHQLLQQAERIKNPEVRTAFLKNVYAHRFILHTARNAIG